MTGLTEVPYLLRAARGEALDRPPVWMMRQAGRYMKAYRDLREKYPSFRERSEIPEVAIEISLQPWKAFRPGLSSRWCYFVFRHCNPPTWSGH